jgi:hypothetical protein
MAAFAVKEARAATRATGQGRKARDKEQYRVESPLCMYVGSVCPALSTTVCVGVRFCCVLPTPSLKYPSAQALSVACPT